MNIEEFVRETMSQIKNNIDEKNHQEVKSGDIYLSSPVEFDLAVVVVSTDNSSSKISGGGNIKIASVDSEKTDSFETQSKTTSRIKFSMSIVG